MRALAVALIAGLLGAAVLGAMRPAPAAAHPLGNFTTNLYAGIALYADALRVRYVVDMAEIPAFREIGAIDRDGDGAVGETEAAAYLEEVVPRLVGALSLLVDGDRAPLDVRSQALSFPEGQGGLSTLRLELVLEAAPVSGMRRVEFADANYDARIGWREIVVRPALGVPLATSTAPAEGVSDALRSYPSELRSSPLNVRSASFEYESGRGASAPAIEGFGGAALEPAPERAGGAFVSLISIEQVSVPVVLVALLAAMGFGALHALEPGHGKTLVAAYFVGVRGTPLHALGLGLVIAGTHTLVVLTIGALTLYGSRFIMPEQLYHWLSLSSGFLVIGLGLWLLLSRVGVLRRGPTHVHLASRGHHHHDDHHGDHDHNHSQKKSAPPWRGLVALGLIDGLVPTLSTLVVLLAAISLDRIELGMLLIVAFSVGLAVVLATISLGVVYARRLLEHVGGALGGPGGGARRDGRLGRALRLARPDGPLPIALGVSGALVLVSVGVFLSLRALSQPELLGI